MKQFDDSNKEASQFRALERGGNLRPDVFGGSLCLLRVSHGHVRSHLMIRLLFKEASLSGIRIWTESGMHLRSFWFINHMFRYTRLAELKNRVKLLR